MTFLKYAFLIFFGICAGGVIAAGVYAFLAMIGVFVRLMGRTNTGKKARLYEKWIIAGGILGNAADIYEIPMILGKGPGTLFFNGSRPFHRRFCRLSGYVISRDFEGSSCHEPQDRSGGRAAVSDTGHCCREVCRGLDLFLEGTGRLAEEEVIMEIDKKKYEEYVKRITPVHAFWPTLGKAFLTGGLICTLGQFINNWLMNSRGLEQEAAGAWTSLTLILLSVLLTGFNIYPKLVTFGGAGALVPITGFANSVAAPAIEFHAEGEVFGVGCKIFTIAGPVILYGVLASWALGAVYWIGGMMGIF